MAKVARRSRMSGSIQDAVVGIWVESKMLPLRVGHRPTMAAALRLLRLFRSADDVVSRHPRRGTAATVVWFSWTTGIAIAGPGGRIGVPRARRRNGMYSPQKEPSALMRAVAVEQDIKLSKRLSNA
jgi:hypothetical protein